MKKIALLLIGALTVVSLMGCVNPNSDQKYPTYTFPIDQSISTATSTAAITVTPTATVNAYTKYTINITGLVADIGKKFVVAGASIGSTTSNIGDNWNTASATVADSGLVGTVDASGTFSITFYGKAPGWAAAANGAQFKIVYYDETNKENWKSSTVLQLNGDNFCVAGATGNDIVLTIDPNKL